MKKDGQSRDPLIEERLHAAMLYAYSVTPVQGLAGYSRVQCVYRIYLYFDGLPLQNVIT